MNTRVFAVGVLLLASIVVAPPAASARGKEIPFPVEKTTILREEKVVYTVEGRIRIPQGVEVTCLRDVHVIGKGEGAVIEVEGSFKVHGVGAREVIFENVAVELLEDFESVHMDMAIFRKGACVRTVPEKAVRGDRFFLEMVEFREDATLDLTFMEGPITLSSVCSDRPVHIRAVDPPDTEENRIKLIVRGCVQYHPHVGFAGGLIVENVYDATIRINRMAGELSAFRDCRTLIFDGNKVNSKRLELVQTGDGDFRRTKMMKCDLYSEKVLFASKRTDEKEKDRLFVDRCWFHGLQNPKEVMGTVVEDGGDDAENVLELKLGKLGKRPLELAGAWDR